MNIKIYTIIYIKFQKVYIKNILIKSKKVKTWFKI